MIWVRNLSITVKMGTIDNDKCLKDEVRLEFRLKPTVDANSLVLDTVCGFSIDFT